MRDSRRGAPVTRNAAIAMAATGVIQLALTLGDLETGLILASTLAIAPAPSAWWTVNR